MKFLLLVLSFIISSSASHQCIPNLSCISTEGYENRLRLNLNCFNSTHLEANWTGPADSTRRLYLDCQTTNETKCIIDLGPLEEASGSIKVMKPNETSSCMLLGCGIIQFPISSLLDDIYYKSTSNNLTLCKELSQIAESSFLYSSLADSIVSTIPQALFTTIFTTVVHSSDALLINATATPTIHKSHVQSHVQSTSFISRSSTSTTQTPSTGSTDQPITFENLLIVALIITLTTLVFIGCTFLCVVIIILSKRKKEPTMSEIIDMRKFRQDSIISYNPPPKPFTQPLSVPVISHPSRVPMGRYSASTEDDSVFESDVTKEGTDSGIDEHTSTTSEIKNHIYSVSTNENINNNFIVTGNVSSQHNDSILSSSVLTIEDGYIANDSETIISNGDENKSGHISNESATQYNITNDSGFIMCSTIDDDMGYIGSTSTNEDREYIHNKESTPTHTEPMYSNNHNIDERPIPNNQCISSDYEGYIYQY